MNGEAVPRRGEIWWILSDKRRPAVVVQTDKIRDARIRSFLVVPLTSQLQLEGFPGNVRLDRRTAGLKKASIANVYDVQKVLRIDFMERKGKLSPDQLRLLEKGLRIALDL